MENAAVPGQPGLCDTHTVGRPVPHSDGMLGASCTAGRSCRSSYPTLDSAVVQSVWNHRRGGGRRAAEAGRDRERRNTERERDRDRMGPPHPQSPPRLSELDVSWPTVVAQALQLFLQRVMFNVGQSVASAKTPRGPLDS